jgi:hypothetical protein
MTHYVNLATLSRRELENLLLTEHAALSRILEAVRNYTEAQWKVRREVEQIVQETVDRRPFVVAYTRGAETDLERRQANRNAAQWNRWMEVEA